MLQLGTRWLNCELVYIHDGDNAITSASPRAFEVIKQYIGHFPHSRITNIWLDHEAKIFFSSEQFRETRAGKENSFCTSKDEFLKSKWGEPFVNNIINKFNEQEGLCFYSKLPLQEKYNYVYKHPFAISVERINNKQGYLMDNVRLTRRLFNLGRGSYDGNFQEVMSELVRELKNK